MANGVLLDPFGSGQGSSVPDTGVKTSPIILDPFATSESKPTSSVPQTPASSLVMDPFSVSGPMTNRLMDREYRVKETETEDGISPFTVLEAIDRPRSAVVSGIITAIEQEEFNPEEIKSEVEKGWYGKQHPMMGEYFAEKIKQARENPEEYPTMSKVYDWLNNQLESSFGVYRTQATVQEAITSGLLGDFIKFKTAETENEKEDAKTQLNISLNKFAENVTDYYKEGAAIESAAHVVGFGADVGLDPVTYLNPIVGFIKQGGSFVLRAIPDSVVDKFAKAGNTTKEKAKEFLTTNKVGRPIGEAADWAWSLFSTKHNLKKQGDAAILQERFMNMVGNARVQAIREGREFQNRIKDFARETGVPEAEVEKFITEAVERGGVQNVDYKYLPKESVDLLANNDNIRYEVWSLGQRNADQLQKEIDAGIRISPLEEQALIRQPTTVTDPVMQEYMARAITPEARDAINIKREALKLKPIGEREPIRLTGGHGSVIQRSEDWEGLTIQDINQLARDGNLPGYEGTKFDKGFFYDDPAISQAIRDDRHYRSMAAKQLADSIIDPTAGFATSPDTVMQMAREAGWAPKGKQQNTVNQALQFLKEKDPGTWQFFDVSKNPLTEGFVMDRDIIKFVDDNINSIYNPKEVNKFLDKWDQVTGWWKSWTLSIFPSYHFRNSVGNMWNNFVVGVDNMAYRDAYKFQDAMFGSRYIDNSGVGGAQAFPNPAGGLDKTYGKYVTKDGTEYSYIELRDLMDEHGVIGRGFMSMDIETTLRSEMGDAKWLTLSRENKAIEIGKRTGEALENNARIANFLDGLNKGMTPAEAAARVKKTLFDYSDLTEAEQAVFKRLMPFYTWTRKNIPFQVEGMIKHPGKYKAVDTLRQEIEAAVDKEDKNERYLASWMVENYPTKVKVDEKTGEARYFIMGGWLPAADVWKLAAAPKRVVVDNLHPALKILYEMTSANKEGYVTDLFTGQQLHPDLNVDFAGVNMGETTAHYLSNIRLLSTIDDFYQTYLAETGQAPEKISPFSGKNKTAEEAFIQFLTGFRTYATNLDNQRLFYIKGKVGETEQKKKLYETSVRRGTPQPELKEQSIEAIGEIRNAKSKGGMLDQSRRLFRKGGYLRTRKGYAEGGSVEEDRDPEAVSTEGVKRFNLFEHYNPNAVQVIDPNEDPEYVSMEGIDMSNKEEAQKDLAEFGKDMIPVYGEIRSGERAIEEFKKGNYGTAALEAAGAIPLVGMGVRAITKGAKLGKEIIPEAAKRIAVEAPNDLPGFYGGPVSRAWAVGKGGMQMLGNTIKTSLSPSALADFKNFGFGAGMRDVLETNVKVINDNQRIKNILTKKMDEVGEASPDYERLSLQLAQAKDSIQEAEKVIVGQLGYNANIARQMGIDSPVLSKWSDRFNKELLDYNPTTFKNSIEKYSVYGRGAVTKNDVDYFYDQISKAWDVGEGDKAKMVVRSMATYKGRGGDFRQDIFSSTQGGALRKFIKDGANDADSLEAAIKAHNDDIANQLSKFNKLEMKTLPEAAALANRRIVIKKKEGDNLYIAFSKASSSKTEGGVNVQMKINPKKQEAYAIVSDEHDLFGKVPPGSSRLITVTPIQRMDELLDPTKVYSGTKTERAREAAVAANEEAMAMALKAKEYKMPEGLQKVDGTQLEKAEGLTKDQVKQINDILSTRSEGQRDILRNAVMGSTIYRGVTGGEEEQGFAEGGLVKQMGNLKL